MDESYINSGINKKAISDVLEMASELTIFLVGDAFRSIHHMSADVAYLPKLPGRARRPRFLADIRIHQLEWNRCYLLIDITAENLEFHQVLPSACIDFSDGFQIRGFE